MILVTLGISAALAACFWYLARDDRGAERVFKWAAGCGILFYSAGTVPLIVQCLVVLGGSLACLVLRGRPWALFGVVLVSPLVGLGVAFSISYNELGQIAQLRERFPLESVEERLSYETRRHARNAAEQTSPSAVLMSPDVDRRLAAREAERNHWMSQYLERLHRRQTDDFTAVSGFGSVRMLGFGIPSRQYVELPRVESPRLSPSLARSASEETTGAWSPLESSPESQAEYETMRQVHDSGADDFLDSTRFAYVQDRAHVAGFVSHRFSTLPTAGETADAVRKWQILRLELISLLKHEQPAAYVSEYLPQMDKLREAKTRPLDPFERASLERLRSAEDVVIAVAGDRIRMVGALRAGRDCQECHAVARGELLGALSYELVLAADGAERPEAPPIEPPQAAPAAAF